jgi:hypothetical protein
VQQQEQQQQQQQGGDAPTAAAPSTAQQHEQQEKLGGDGSSINPFERLTATANPDSISTFAIARVSAASASPSGEREPSSAAAGRSRRHSVELLGWLASQDDSMLAALGQRVAQDSLSSVAASGDDERCGVCLVEATLCDWVAMGPCAHRICIVFVCAGEIINLHATDAAPCPFCRKLHTHRRVWARADRRARPLSGAEWQSGGVAEFFRGGRGEWLLEAPRQGASDQTRPPHQGAFQSTSSEQLANACLCKSSRTTETHAASHHRLEAYVRV